MALTDVNIRKAKPGASIIKLSDGNGLQLWITPAGGKHWKLAYRFGPPPKPKQKVLPLGAYPAVGLSDARRLSGSARALLAQGIDPNVEKKAARNPVAAPTFGEIAAKYLEKKR